MTQQFQPRDWQIENMNTFLSCILDQGMNLYAFEACMAAGKSMMDAWIAKTILEDERLTNRLGLFDHGIILVPSISIQGMPASVRGPATGMCDDFANLGLTIRTQFMVDRRIARQPLPKAFDVSVITYQAILNPEFLETIRLWQKNDDWRFFLICDEVHHTRQFRGAWGEALEALISLAGLCIVQSGTYFRTDGFPIRFLKYQDNGSPAVQYCYSLTRGIMDRVVRPVAFRKFDSTSDKIDADANELVGQIRLSQVETLEDLNLVKRDALAADGKCIRQMIAEVHADLMRSRQRFPDAAALFAAKPGFASNDDGDDRYVFQIAAAVKDVTGVDPTVFTYRDPDDVSQDKLRQFRFGKEPYAVAVNKIAEGCNIPRFRHIAFCRYTESEMMFRQIAGRALRWTPEDDGTAAMIYMPAFPIMNQFAENMEGESLEGVKKFLCQACGQYPCVCPCDLCGQNPCECPCPHCGESPCICLRPPPPPKPFMMTANIKIEGGGGIISGEGVGEPYIDAAANLAQQYASFRHSNKVQIGFAIQVGANGRAIQEAPTVPKEADRQHVERRINKAVKQLANLKYRDIADDGMRYSQSWQREFEQRYGTAWKVAKQQWSTARMEVAAEDLELECKNERRKHR